MYDKQEIRALLPGLEKKVPLKNGKYVRGINFDNAATTPPFIDAISTIEALAPWYSSIHRGTGYKSVKTTELYDKSREKVLKFVGANPVKYSVIYVKNATEGLNKLSYRLIKDKRDVVISTFMEHHSNDLPWRYKCTVDYAGINKDGTLDMKDLQNKIDKYKGRLKIVTVTAASNVTGAVNDVHAIAKMAHKAGASIIVDGAQYVPHRKICMDGKNNAESIDYLVFSAHKMYAPFGTGVIIGPTDALNKGIPEYMGGGTIKIVTHKEVVFDDTPMKDEAGTPNVLGVMALISSINIMEKIGMDYIERDERELTEYILENMRKLPVKIYGPEDAKDRVGIITFEVPGISHRRVAELLSENFGIAVRNGCFCAHPYVVKLMGISEEELNKYIRNPDTEKKGLVRISLGIYNTKKEADVFIDAMEKICLYKENM